MPTENLSFFIENWIDNKEYLNWPGLQYIWYTKIKPAIHNGIQIKNSTKARLHDENWYISYDSMIEENEAKLFSFGSIINLTDDNNGIVYIALTEDNSVSIYDKNNKYGTTKYNNGMIQVVDSSVSNILYGFIDDSIGNIGNNSDKIVDETGELYVVFDINYEYNGNYTPPTQ